MTNVSPSDLDGLSSERAARAHWIIACGATAVGVGASVFAMKLFPKTASLFSTSPAIVATILWPALAVVALTKAAQRAVGSGPRRVLFAVGYAFIAISAFALSLALAGPWSGISLSNPALSGGYPTTR